MTRIRFARRAAAALLMTLALTGAAAARTVQDFAGHWLFKLGDRSFIALDLTADGGTTGPMQGVLTRPRRFQTSDGVAFLRIELPVVRSPLVRSALDGDWRSALREWSGDPDFYTHRERPLDETLPWDHLDVGVRKTGLLREHQRAGLSPETAPAG